MLLAIFVLIASYLIGAIPFGWLVARTRGVDIFRAGSGNIGATNVGRVLGKKYGLLVFAFDFIKGAGPVLAVALLPAEVHDSLGWPNALRVGSALAAFLGHMFPIYLGFRGGKGVATGLGTILVLVPGPTALAVLACLAVVGPTRMISVGSITAVFMLGVARILSVSDPFGRDGILVTAYLLGGSALIVWKHRANMKRILSGTENRMEDRPMFGTLAKGVHVLALGLWFGGSVMFNFVVAPTVFFDVFPNVVENSPSDRTAYLALAPGASGEERKNLAGALAGSVVGPIFPQYFAIQGVCAFLALATALGWWSRPGRVHRWRVYLIGLASAGVLVGWPISMKVSALRLERFATDPAIAEAAKASFATWHLASLGLSVVTVGLAGFGLALAAKLPDEGTRNRPG